MRGAATEPLSPSATHAGERSVAAAWAAAAGCVAFYLTLQALPVDPATRVALSAVLVVLVLAVSAVLCWRATVAAAGKTRRLWRTLTIALGFFLLGMVARAYYVFTTGSFGPAGSLEDIGFALGLLTLVPVVLLMTDSFDSRPVRKARNGLDFLIALALIFIVIYLGLALPLRTYSSGALWVHNLLFLAFPTIIASLVAYLVTFKRGHWRPEELVLLAALTVGAGAVIALIAGIGLDLASAQSWLNAVATGLLVMAFALFGVAAVYGRAAVYRRPPDSSAALEHLHWPTAVAQAVALVSIPLLLLFARQLAGVEGAGLLIVATAVLAAAVVARNWLAMYESRQIAAQSIIDPSTGLFNRRHFHDRLREEVGEALAGGVPLVLYLVRLDGIDEFVAERGYAAAERRIEWFADTLRALAFDDSLVFRLGRITFARIVPASTVEAVGAECEQLGREATAPSDGSGVPLAFWVGMAGVPEHALDSRDLFRLAEGALYWAETSGAGTVVIYDADTVQAHDPRQHLNMLEEDTHSRLVETLAAAVDARDPYTQDHSVNVARLAVLVAKRMGMSEERVALLGAAAQLHDVGKIGVPDSVLRKPSRLTDEEYALIQEHPALGVRILAASARKEMLPWIHQHHEWLDGRGYPQGLSGDDICLEARILSACDAYDAITTDRPYRSGAPVDKAIAELRRHSGTQFDPAIVEHLVSVLADYELARRAAPAPASVWSASA